jgi:hypothetical protein
MNYFLLVLCLVVLSCTTSNNNNNYNYKQQGCEWIGKGNSGFYEDYFAVKSTDVWDYGGNTIITVIYSNDCNR